MWLNHTSNTTSTTRASLQVHHQQPSERRPRSTARRQTLSAPQFRTTQHEALNCVFVLLSQQAADAVRLEREASRPDTNTAPQPELPPPRSPAREPGEPGPLAFPALRRSPPPGLQPPFPEPFHPITSARSPCPLPSFDPLPWGLPPHPADLPGSPTSRTSPVRRPARPGPAPCPAPAP